MKTKRIDTDRFTGEATEPPVWGHCSYCGEEIREGARFFVHEGLCICTECSRDYAYSEFERDASPQTAQRANRRSDYGE